MFEITVSFPVANFQEQTLYLEKLTVRKSNILALYKILLKTQNKLACEIIVSFFQLHLFLPVHVIRKLSKSMVIEFEYHTVLAGLICCFS